MLIFVEDGIFKCVCANKDTDRIKKTVLEVLEINYETLKVFKIADSVKFKKLFSATPDKIRFDGTDNFILENVIKEEYDETVYHNLTDDDALSFYTQEEIDTYTNDISEIEAEEAMDVKPDPRYTPISKYLDGTEELKKDIIHHDKEVEICCETKGVEVSKAVVFNG